MPLLVHHYDRVESTQDQAFQLLDSGVATPFYVTTDYQAAGRGRMGRNWHMEKGRSICFSLVVSMPAVRLTGLSLVAGLAIRAALDREDIRLKWPNDLMLADQKVGGILVESRSQGTRADVVVGVGLNLLDQLEEKFVGVKTSIDLERMVDSLYSTIQRFEELGFEGFREEYASRMWRVGQGAVLKIQDEEKSIEIMGVSESGSLLCRRNGNLEMNDQGEIVIAS